MKPERIQIFPTGPLVPTVPTPPVAPVAPKGDRGVYQTLRFDSFRKAVNFANFAEDMAVNHGLDVTCQTDQRTYEVELLAAIDGSTGSEEAALQISVAWKFFDEVKSIHAVWSAPTQAS